MILAFASLVSVSSAADRIVFKRFAPTQASLFISNADGRGEQPLTRPGSLDYNPVWSASGEWIVFTSERNGSADLYRMHPDGSGFERLTDNPAYDDQAALSPDGKRVVFVSTRAAGTANLWMLDLATRTFTPLTSGHGGDFRPAWSPDGKWIAFSSDRDSTLPPAKGRWERLHVVDIYIVRPDGTGLRRLSKHGNFCGNPQWMHDSQSILTYCMSAEDSFYFTVGTTDGDTQFVRLDIGTGKSTPVDAGTGVKVYPAVLAADAVAYVRRRSAKPGVYYASGKEGPMGADVRSPSWSPDGRRVVYSRYVTQRPDEPAKLWSRNSKYELFGTAILPAYDRTGQHLAQTRRNPGGGTSLMVIDEGKPARAIFESSDFILAPQWSPDRQRIVFGIGGFTTFADFAFKREHPHDPVNGGAQVATVNVDGSGFHRLTDGPNNNAFASFAPDGKQIVYRTAGPDGDGLRTMNLDNHTVSILTKEWDNFPVWSPRGDLIVFIRRTGIDFGVFTIHADGTDAKQLTDTHGNDAHAAWSPDGEHIVFTSSRMGFKDESIYSEAPQPYGEIFVMRSDGTQVEQLTDDQWEEGGAAWQQPN
jgi:TolB protein